MSVHVAIQNFISVFVDIYNIPDIRQVIKMFSIAVCDDEVIECCHMAKKIKDILEELKIPCMIRRFCNGRELLQASESFDIVFLDIMMQDLDGMKTAQIFREKSFDKILIFISSSREYVFDAYDVEAFQYLLKPVDETKLKRVLLEAVLRNLSLSAGKGRKRNYFLTIYTISRSKGESLMYMARKVFLLITGRSESWRTSCGIKGFSGVIKVF